MGKEAACRARLDGKSARGKALLETSELVFRSTVRGQLRVAVPFKEMTVVTAGASDLTVVWGGRHAGAGAAGDRGAAVGGAHPQSAKPPR